MHTFCREQETTRLKKARNRKWKRYGLIAVAAVGGGALVGLTGGLAAPLVAAGAGLFVFLGLCFFFTFVNNTK